MTALVRHLKWVDYSSLSLSQVMFETYQFEGLYIAIQAVLTLYAQGNSTVCWYTVLELLYSCFIPLFVGTAHIFIIEIFGYFLNI